MSSIAKPFTNFTNALPAYQKIPVPVELLRTATKLDIAAGPTGAPAQYGILFKSNFPSGAADTISIYFPTASARDTSFTNVLSAFSTATA